jgi:glycosyltransferase involved in cell wall biosynthesis
MVGLITEMISPYRIPVFNALSEQLGGRLRVFFLTERAARSWPVYRSEIRFDYEVLPGFSVRIGSQTERVYCNLPAMIRQRGDDVEAMIVGGYNHLEAMWTLTSARLRGHPVVLWSESVPVTGGSRPIRTVAKRRVVRRFDAHVVPGRRAAELLRALGAPPGRIFTAPNAVDVEFWSAGATPREAQPRRPRLLFVGWLTYRKGLDVLLDALDTDDLRGLDLDVVGEGAEGAALAIRARSRGVRAKFLGHLDREALRERYRGADVLVFPTRADPWGLVINEAMATGCVPVASTAAGAAHDLVTDDETGLVVAPGDVEGLRAALRRLTDSELLSKLSAAALERGRQQTPERCAAGFVEAVEATQ